MKNAKTTLPHIASRWPSLRALSSFRHMSHKNSMQGLKKVFFIFYRVSAISVTVLFCSNLVFAETIDELKAKAEAGDAKAQLALGVCYSKGEGVSVDKAKAVQWFRKAAEAGDPNAQRSLGYAYGDGEGVEKNYETSFFWIKKAADQGDLTAMNNLAYMYEDGTGAPKNPVKAFEVMQKAAELGHASSMSNLAFMYIRGTGVPENPKKAFEFWKKAAELGDATAQNNLAFAYRDGIGVGANPEEAFEWWQKAAQSGDLIAQKMVADALLNGKGVEKNIEDAKKWNEKVFQQILDRAENGDPKFQHELANKYIWGDGVEKNLTKGFYWLTKAAESGNINAQAQLGLSYTKRHGVILGDYSYKNPEEARKWLYMAAEAGSSDAQRYLGVQFAYGNDGFEKNIKEALKWYRKAAENGDQISLRNAKKLEEELEAANDKSFDKMLNELEADVSKTTSQAKLALLIANSNYSQFGGLARTESDAKSLSNVLGSMGFQVFLLKNASREQMLDALKSFENKVRGTEALAFFHYGGHGVQVDGKNYLIPADAEIPDERRVATRAVDLDEVIASIEMAKPKASVLVVDACRHNPLPASPTRAATRGLAVVGRKPKNSVIIFAAEAGNEALDGLFTPIFAKNLQQHGDKSLNQIMQKVRAEVFERSNGAQTPGEYNQLFDDVYLYKDK